jgi:hypothetical protein
VTVRDVLPRDAISSVDEPRFGVAYFGEPGDEVIVIDDERTSSLEDQRTAKIHQASELESELEKIVGEMVVDSTASP